MKKVWSYLKGKKRIISILILLANSGIQAFAPGLVSPEIHNWVNTAGLAVGGVGVWDAVQQNIKNAKK